MTLDKQSKAQKKHRQRQTVCKRRFLFGNSASKFTQGYLSYKSENNDANVHQRSDAFFAYDILLTFLFSSLWLVLCF